MNRRLTLVPGNLLSSRLLGMASASKPVPSPSPAYALGDPGGPAEIPTLVIPIFDDSRSVISPAGTDPLSNRFAEVAHAFSVIARKGSRHELGAVLHFDTPSRRDVGPVPITRLGLLVLRWGLRVPPGGIGSSELAPSLHRAVKIAEAHPDHQATVVVLSDFQLLDPDPGQVLAELAAFPGQVHAVVLGSGLPAGVLDERITVTPIQPDEPPGAVARVLFASLTTHRPGSRPGPLTTADVVPRRRLSWIPQRLSRTLRGGTGGAS